MVISNFRLTESELFILKRSLDKFLINYHGSYELDGLDKAILHQDIAVISAIRNDIEEYFDDLEKRASDQVVIESNIE